MADRIISAIRWAVRLSVVYAGTAYADPCTAPIPAAGTAIEGTVRYIIDGDGLCVGRSPDPSTWVEIRIADFYAAELHDAGGLEAKRTLERLTFGRQIRCLAGKRSYDRTVARCTVAAGDVGDLMRSAGVGAGRSRLRPH